ncbi:carboxymuconolactone decarboxylase family protein [Pseudomonas sp.]|uniref:carboxymuconolactone decarboxylase family protein n=1 Tax=Pseudomonas sp. TaxID=306 RepID=UPI003A9865E9
MPRLSTTYPSSASGAVSEIYASIQKTAGMVPNVYATIGTHAPTSLKAILEIDEIIEASTLSKSEIEAIRLAASVNAGCEYSIAAHAFLSQFSGLSQDTVSDIRSLRSTKIERLDALIDFVHVLINTRGVVDLSCVQKLLDFNCTEKNLIEICLVVTSTKFINFVNRINDTPIDFPQSAPENEAL